MRKVARAAVFFLLPTVNCPLLTYSKDDMEVVMNRVFVAVLGAVCAVGLVVAGLWGWQRAESVVTWVGWEKRTIGAWAVRCAAVALVAVAQTVLLAGVVERVYRRDAVCSVMKMSALFVCMVCTASAIALGLAGR